MFVHMGYKTFKSYENGTKCRLAINNLLLWWLIVISKNDSEPFFSILDINFMFLCCLLREFFILWTWSFDRQSKSVSLTIRLLKISLKWAGQISNQIFSKWHIKTLVNLGSKGESITTLSHCWYNFSSKIKSWLKHVYFRQVKKQLLVKLSTCVWWKK